VNYSSNYKVTACEITHDQPLNVTAQNVEYLLA
jgi:hypothetical protein